jgi:cellulose biosynthesis protein BcsQ
LNVFFNIINKYIRKDPDLADKEGFILWQAGRSRLEAEGGKDREQPERVFNLPVNPGALSGHGKIYTVQSSAKGDGASTVAVNMAGLLALSCPERVVLIDLDGYGSVRSRMGLPAGECLVNICDWEDVQNSRDMAGRLYCHSSGVLVVPGVIHHDHVEMVTPALIFKMLTLLKENYDYIILDCPPVGMDNNTWAAALVSDVIFTVFKPDRTSLDLLKENNGFILRLGCQDRVCLVLNQAGIPGGIRPGDVEGSLGPDIISVLPYSVGVAESNNRRQIAAQVRQKDVFSQAMQALVEKIQA